MERILDSRMHRRRLQYLVEWEGYGTEGNTWEDAGNISNAPDKVAEFHASNPAAPRRIRAMAFGSIPFRPISLTDQAPSRCFSKGGVIVRGTLADPTKTPSAARPLPSTARPLTFATRSLTSAACSLARPSTFDPAMPTTPRYVPPHRRTHPLSDRPTQ